MFLLQKALETYQQNEHEVGKIHKTSHKGIEEIQTLLPISHRIKKTQLEFTLNENGELLKITCSDKFIIIPTTIFSSSRTNTPAPHALHDDLKSIAFDAWKLSHPGEVEPEINLIEEKKDSLKKARLGHESYLSLLEKWIAYEPNWKLQAIYQYVQNNTIIEDLITHGILEKQPNFKYSASKNKAIVGNVALGKSHKQLLKNTIRFNVRHNKDIEDTSIPLWEDIALMNSYKDFYVNIYLPTIDIPTATCLITGKRKPIASSVMKSIRSSDDQGKLISINDKYFDTGFFKRNRKSQSLGNVASIGYIEAEKAFAALKWLIERQSFSLSHTHKLLIWRTSDTQAFNLLNDISDVMNDEAQLFLEEFNDLFEESAEATTNLIQQRNSQSTTYEPYINALRKALLGFGKTDQLLNPSHEIFLLRIDSFNTGRFYIREFLHMPETQYVENIITWQQRTMWKLSYEKKKRRYDYWGAPNIHQIVSHLASEKKKIDENMEITKYSADLIACVLHDRPIPSNILHNLERRLYNRNLTKFDTIQQWYDLQNLTCSLLKNNYGRKGEFFDMSLQKDLTDRSYLFGRWLAIAHLLEEKTLKLDNKNSRETNAMRYFQNYLQRPFTTLHEISKKIQPYKMKLKKSHISLYYHYEKLFDEVLELFKFDEFNDTTLNGKIHLGFTNQRVAMTHKKHAIIENAAE